MLASREEWTKIDDLPEGKIAGWLVPDLGDERMNSSVFLGGETQVETCSLLIARRDTGSLLRSFERRYELRILEMDRGKETTAMFFRSELHPDRAFSMTVFDSFKLGDRAFHLSQMAVFAPLNH
ncbi:hypothetical protein BV509_00900 [Rhodovulum sulfidophilum]|nr:hypothetical protein BV509_00900 [Rhodovulum sulfidophilum]